VSLETSCACKMLWFLSSTSFLPRQMSLYSTGIQRLHAYQEFCTDLIAQVRNMKSDATGRFAAVERLRMYVSHYPSVKRRSRLKI
jgi:hypothetical protein